MYKLKDSLRSRRSATEAFTVAEIMIAAIIILIVLVSAAYGITSAVRSAAYVENYTKAGQLANQQVAIAKQAPYSELWIPRTADGDLIGNFKCAPTATPAPSGTTYAETGSGDQYPGLTYCQTKKFGGSGGVGTTFYIQTTVLYIETGSAYDGSSIGDTPSGYFSKRVLVTVRWADISANVGASDTNSRQVIQQTYTRSPTTGECIPDIVNSGGTVLTGCAP